MGSIRLKIHPLFLVFGVFYAVIGEFWYFVIFSLTALIHELGHSFVAEGLGYKLNKITLMPFGAVVSGDDCQMKAKDEIKIALAGPLVNLFVGVFLVATWWIYPETYTYTDLVAYANFSMAGINLIPAKPLDGGRVLCSWLALMCGRKKADKIAKILGVVLGLSLIALFVITLFKKPNYSILLFASFILFGLLIKNTNYVRSFRGVSQKQLMRGVPVVKQAIDKSASVKSLLYILDPDAVNELTVFSEGKAVCSLSQEKITEIMLNGELYAPISKYLPRIKHNIS